MREGNTVSILFSLKYEYIIYIYGYILLCVVKTVVTKDKFIIHTFSLAQSAPSAPLANWPGCDRKTKCLLNPLNHMKDEKKNAVFDFSLITSFLLRLHFFVKFCQVLYVIFWLIWCYVYPCLLMTVLKCLVLWYDSFYVNYLNFYLTNFWAPVYMLLKISIFRWLCKKFQLLLLPEEYLKKFVFYKAISRLYLLF